MCPICLYRGVLVCRIHFWCYFCNLMLDYIHIEVGGQTPSCKSTMYLIIICNMMCNMGFYQKIRNDITVRWIGLKDLRNKQKIKYNVSYFFIFIPTRPNGPKLGHQGHLHPHCFIQDHHQNHLEGCCIFNLFHSVLFRWFENLPLAVNGFKQSCPPWQLQNGVLLVASIYLRRTLIALHWITSSNSGGAGLPSAMTDI